MIEKYLGASVIFCIFMIIAQSWTINVPESTTQLDAIQLQQQQQEQEQQQLPFSGQHLSIAVNNNNNNNRATNAASAPQQRRHHTSYDGNDDVVDGVAANSTISLEAQPAQQQQQQQQRLLSPHSHTRRTRHTRQRRSLSDWLIAPNTRWCGRGNTANGTYNHLGGASSADKCCRKHDHCQAFIPAMSNRYDLFNYRPYTLSHCSCDRRFRTCLKMANDEDANTIGKLFFNIVQTQCFILRKEHICQQRAVDGSCSAEHVKQKAYLKNNKRY